MVETVETHMRYNLFLTSLDTGGLDWANTPVSGVKSCEFQWESARSGFRQNEV